MVSHYIRYRNLYGLIGVGVAKKIDTLNTSHSIVTFENFISLRQDDIKLCYSNYFEQNKKGLSYSHCLGGNKKYSFYFG